MKEERKANIGNALDGALSLFLGAQGMNVLTNPDAYGISGPILPISSFVLGKSLAKGERPTQSLPLALGSAGAELAIPLIAKATNKVKEFGVREFDTPAKTLALRAFGSTALPLGIGALYGALTKMRPEAKPQEQE